MPEGSVIVDGVDSMSEDTEVEAENLENQEVGSSQPSSSEPQGQGEVKTEPKTESKVQYTEKGTKLASDPLSALNQQLANERAKVRQYEQFLSDPQSLKRYLEDLEKELGQAQGSQASEGEITPSMVQTTEDLQRYLAQETRKIQSALQEIQNLKLSFIGTATEQAINSRIEREIDEVWRKYPQLRPTNPDGSRNPDFDPELEAELGELFDKLDFDPENNRYRGQVSLLELADHLMKVASKGQAAGLKKAQTVVQDKRIGRVISASPAETAPDESNLTPSQIIAARMKRAASAKR